MTLPDAVPSRRNDLDWLRIGAFGLLIFYHVGMFYVTWDWHVKSSQASTAIEPLMRLSNPWRLTLLFVISGCATRFMLDKMSWGRFLGSRTVRLVVPLLFGVFVIVPPQSYYEVTEALGPFGWGEFYQRYVTASGNWCDADGCLITPTYNHLWFVAYLFIYTVLIVPVGPLAKSLPRALAPLAKGLPAIVLPWMFLTVTLVTLRPIFGETHAIVDDWYNHAVYFPAFLFGYAIAKHEAFFESCARMRWPMVVVAMAAWVALEIYRSVIGPITLESGLPIMLTGAGLRELQAWAMILALFGFARKHLRRDGLVRRYLTDAIFPFYIIHQTVIVVAGYHLDKLGWPLWIEAPLVIAITLAACWIGYEIARRVGFLRPLFGLKVEGRPAPVTASAAPAP